MPSSLELTLTFVTHGRSSAELGLDDDFGAFVAGEERGVDPHELQQISDFQQISRSEGWCTGLQPAQLSEFLFKTALSSACTT